MYHLVDHLLSCVVVLLGCGSGGVGAHGHIATAYVKHMSSGWALQPAIVKNDRDNANRGRTAYPTEIFIQHA
jgi:hypothetical protein